MPWSYLRVPFSCICLMVQTTLTILEAKLASISGIPSSGAARPSANPSLAAAPAQATATATATPTATSAPAHAQAPAAQPAPQAQQNAAPPPPPEPAAPPPAPKRLVKDDSRFSKYFKMLKVGVPPGAVKGKMVSVPDALPLSLACSLPCPLDRHPPLCIVYSLRQTVSTCMRRHASL
jgi:hypothetical protein